MSLQGLFPVYIISFTIYWTFRKHLETQHAMTLDAYGSQWEPQGQTDAPDQLAAKRLRTPSKPQSPPPPPPPPLSQIKVRDLLISITGTRQE